MTKIQFFQLKADCQIYLQKSSIQALGIKAGVGSQVITDILTGNFEGVNEKYLAKVKHVVKSDTNNGIYKTSDCGAFLKAMEHAQKYNLCIGITGDTGTGKSFMSKAVARKENILYWNCHLHKSARIFFKELLQELNVPCGGMLSEMIERTAQAMSEREILLIVDEADKMHPQIRGAVHTLRDRTAANCGMLLVGMPHFKNDLLRGRNEGKRGYSEFYRRVNIWHHLEGLQADEIKKVLHDAGITAPDVQREFRHYTSFGELVNAIDLHKILNV